MRKARLLTIAAATLAVLALADREPPTAAIRQLTHDAADPAPHRFNAALDLGIVAVSVMYTWTVDRMQ